MEDTLPSPFFFTSTNISHSHFVLCSPVYLLIESHNISTFEASIASNVTPTSLNCHRVRRSRLESRGSTNPLSRSIELSCLVKISMAI
ncbi:hypothetical protein NC651_007680 [Populus alba x Populus x berolinensis]|nr:hypothetical protein NC651_007680 [Populus alba x Populus x berolinensis]